MSPIILKTEVKTVSYGVRTCIYVKIYINIVDKFTILLFCTKLWPGLFYEALFLFL